MVIVINKVVIMVMVINIVIIMVMVINRVIIVITIRPRLLSLKIYLYQYCCPFCMIINLVLVILVITVTNGIISYHTYIIYTIIITIME